MNERLDKITSMLASAPDDPFLRFALAKEYEKMDDQNLALEAYQWLVEHTPEYSGTYYHFGQLLIRRNDLSRAKHILEEGLSITKNQGDLHAHGELRTLYEDWFDV